LRGIPVIPMEINL